MALTPLIQQFMQMRGNLAPALASVEQLYRPPTPSSDGRPTAFQAGNPQGGRGTFEGLSKGGDWKANLSPAERWILTRESGLNPAAKNPTSTAFGIWQGLDYTRKKYLGANWQTTDPWLQLDAFRRYVADRYGNAEKAMQFHQQKGWY